MIEYNPYIILGYLLSKYNNLIHEEKRLSEGVTIDLKMAKTISSFVDLHCPDTKMVAKKLAIAAKSYFLDLFSVNTNQTLYSQTHWRYSWLNQYTEFVKEPSLLGVGLSYDCKIYI